MPPNNNPNTTPNPTENTAWTHKIGRWATAAAGGYALHRIFHANALGNPIEQLGSPGGELAELVVIPATLAVTGLRLQVTNMRLGLARDGVKTARKTEAQSTRRAEKVHDSYTRIMDGVAVPYKVDRSLDKVNPTIWDRLTNALLDHQANSRLLASNTNAHARKVKRMVRARGTRRKAEMEAEQQEKWWGKSVAFDPAEKSDPGPESNDLGWRLGWRRFHQVPRTRHDVRGYRRAVRLRNEELEHAHHTTRKTHEKFVKKGEDRATKHSKRTQSKRQRVVRLQQHRDDIIARQDTVSRLYDGSKKQLAHGARTAVRTVRSDLRSFQQRLGR
jgi:hypothetical protein